LELFTSGKQAIYVRLFSGLCWKKESAPLSRQLQKTWLFSRQQYGAWMNMSIQYGEKAWL